MGATISPQFPRQRVDYARHTCECGRTFIVSYREWIQDTARCECGEYPCILSDAFYPTEFQWHELHVSYSTIARLFRLMGLDSLDYQCGTASPELFIPRLDRLEGERFAESFGRVCQLAQVLKVPIQWG